MAHRHLPRGLDGRTGDQNRPGVARSARSLALTRSKAIGTTELACSRPPDPDGSAERGEERIRGSSESPHRQTAPSEGSSVPAADFGRRLYGRSRSAPTANVFSFTGADVQPRIFQHYLKRLHSASLS